MKNILLRLIFFILTIPGLCNAQSIQWTQKQNLPKAYRNGGAASCNGKIYFMGGYCDSTPERFEKTNYEYDPAANIWELKAELPAGRSNFAIAAINNKIYVIGGDAFSPKNEVYNPASDKWDTLKPMLTPRQHISCAVADGKIYIAGGLMKFEASSAPSEWSYKNITNKNDVYNPLTDTWEEKTPMPTKRHGAFMASVNGKIYVIGGMGTENDMWKSLSVVEMYDPKTDKWETKTSLPEPRDGFGVTVIDNKIYVIGGFSGAGIVNTVFIYDPSRNKWNKTTEFPNLQNGSPGCASIGKKIYIIGGCNKDYKSNGNLFEGTVSKDSNSFDYLGQTPPGDEPVIFAPGLISVKDKNSHALVMSPDGNMIIFSRYPDRTSYVLTKENDKWVGPVESFFYGKEVSFSPDGNRIFYYTDSDIFYVEKLSTGWSSPVKLGPEINTTNLAEFYPSIVKTGDMYFSKDGNWKTGRIMYSKFQNDNFQIPTDLGSPINNGGAIHAWVSPDESYILFNSPRTGSHTKNDIWISFKGSDGKWTKPQNLGENINSGADAILCPTVSPDGKYMFFTKLNFNPVSGYIYWVSTKVIEDIRKEVFNLKATK